LSINNDDNHTQIPPIWIAEPGPSAYYYLGAFASSDWWLSERPFLIAITPSNNNPAESNITLLTPEFEKLRAQGIALPDEVNARVTWVSWQENESPYQVLWDHVGLNGGIVGDGQVRGFILEGLQATASQVENDKSISVSRERQSKMSDIKEAVALVRQRKDEREVGLLRCANQVSPLTSTPKEQADSI
jgi:Xaa-Pro aminopeptidase